MAVDALAQQADLGVLGHEVDLLRRRRDRLLLGHLDAQSCSLREITNASTSTAATTATRGQVGALRVRRLGERLALPASREDDTRASVVRAAQTVGRNSSPRSVPRTMISTIMTQMIEITSIASSNDLDVRLLGRELDLLSVIALTP